MRAHPATKLHSRGFAGNVVQVNLTSTHNPRGFNAKCFRGVRSARRKFLHCFPEGFTDETYLAWERNYKWEAHRRWTHVLNQREMERLLAQRAYSELARRAIQIESRTNLLFSVEKMALRDAVRTPAGARRFATGLRDFLFERESAALKFNRWRGNRPFAQTAGEGTYLASGHRVRLSRAAGATHFSEAHGHPKSGETVSISIPIPISAELEHLCECTGVRRCGPAGFEGHAPTGPNRHSIIPVGAGLR